MGWWYAIADKKFGPISLENLQDLLLKNIANSKTLLWKEGMQEWQTLEAIEELNNLRLLMPPPLPSKQEILISAGYWSRFFARSFDILFVSLIFGLPLGFLLGYFIPSFSSWIQNDGASQIVSLLFFPFIFIFDAFIYKLFGNTLGKALLGIKILNNSQTPLTFQQYLKRNLQVWIKAFAFGIPIINIFTMLYQARQVSTKGVTSYDKIDNFQVLRKRFFWIRLSSFLILFILLWFLIIVIIRFGESKSNINTFSKQNAEAFSLKINPSKDLKSNKFIKEIDKDIFTTEKFKTLGNHSKKIIVTAYFLENFTNKEYFQLQSSEQKRILNNYLETFHIQTIDYSKAEEARKNGIPDKEILDYLAQFDKGIVDAQNGGVPDNHILNYLISIENEPAICKNFDANSARQAGYSYQEIIDYCSKKE